MKKFSETRLLDMNAMERAAESDDPEIALDLLLEPINEAMRIVAERIIDERMVPTGEISVSMTFEAVAE